MPRQGSFIGRHGKKESPCFQRLSKYSGGESGIGSPATQPLQTLAESLLGGFPFNVSSIIAPVLARLLALVVLSASLPPTSVVLG